MQIIPKQPSIKGPAEWFSGDVYIDPVARTEAPSRIHVNSVHFTPGARTAWHSHGLGQTLYVTEGAGLIQSRGDDVHQIRAGDVIHKLGQAPIPDSGTLLQELAAGHPGQQVEVTITRAGQARTVSVTLGTLPGT